MNHHPFDQAITLQHLGAEHAIARWQGATHDAYWNMVGPFGGITAATILQAVLGDPRRNGDPVSLTLTYAAPIVQGGFELHSHLVAATRSTQHWSIQLLQNGVVAINAIAMFAVRRDTWSATEATMPVVASAAATPALRSTRFRVAWVDCYTWRFLRGGFDDIAQGPREDSTTQLWIQDAPERPMDFASLTAICDVFFPRLYLRRGETVPAGTVSMNIYFHAGLEALEHVGPQPVLANARGRHFERGFFEQAADIWSPEGRMLASTQQLVWYKN